MVVVRDEVGGAITVLFVLEDALPLQRLHALLLLPARAPAQGVVAAGAGAVLSLQQPLPWAQVQVVIYSRTLQLFVWRHLCCGHSWSVSRRPRPPRGA